MSRKEYISILVDASTAMALKPAAEGEKSFKEIIFECIDSLCEQKLYYNSKSHQVGIMTFSGKAGLCSLRKHSLVDVEYMQSIDKLEEDFEFSSKNDGDTFAALNDLLAQYSKEYPKKGPLHRVFVFTTLEGQSRFTSNSIHELGQLCKDSETRINVIVCKRADEALSTDAFKKNHQLLEVLLGLTQSACFDSKDAFYLYRQLKLKTHLAITKFRGSLEVTPDLKINVCSYTKSTQENMPSLKKFSRLADGSNGQGEVKQERMFYEIDDPSMKPVSKEEVIKAFYYGRQVVPIPKEKKEEMKVSDERQLRLLCFSEEKRVPRHFLLTGTDIIVPVTEPTGNCLAFNSLVDGLLETQKVGIARYVGRAGSAPKLAGLFPHKSATGFRCIYLCQLPTAEDVRDYRFSSLPQSTQSQKELVEQMIGQMDLCAFARPGDTQRFEVLQPGDTFNPISRIFRENLIARGVRGRSVIEGPTPELLEELRPELVTHRQIEEVARQLQSLFEFRTHDLATVTARARIFWQHLLREQREQDRQRDAVAELSLGQKSKQQPGGKDEDHVKDISMIHPVSDFNEMRKNKKVDLAETAIRKMAAIVDRLVQESIRGSYHEKALECLEELRRGAVEEDEPALFNEILRGMRDRYSSGQHAGFWRSIVRRGITLISRTENSTSLVSEEASRAFLKEEEKSLNEKMEEEDLPQDELDEIE